MFRTVNPRLCQSYCSALVGTAGSMVPCCVSNVLARGNGALGRRFSKVPVTRQPKNTSSGATRRFSNFIYRVQRLPFSATVDAPATSESNLTLLQGLEAVIGPISSAPTLSPPKPLVVVISGPSGVGKDAVVKRLQEIRPDLHFVVTATSRQKRPSEVDGVDYHFVSKEQFESWMAAGELLEYAVVYGEYKGIPRQQVTDALACSKNVVLRIDVQGSATVRKLLPGIVSIFLVAESERELVQRLVARKTESFEKLAVRIATARSEMAHVHEFDYIVVNRDGLLDETVRILSAIIDVEKTRVDRSFPSLPSGQFSPTCA